MAHDAATAPTLTMAAAETTTKRPRSAVTVALLVLASCRLALAFSSRASSSSSPSTSPDDDDPAAARGVEPVGYLASVASSVLAAYVASAGTCPGGRPRRRRRLSAAAMLAELRRTWARPVATALYIELLTAAMVLLLRTLGELLAALGGGESSSAAAGILAASGSVALVGWLATVLFAHSDIACRMSLVVAAVEEEGYGGAAAVRRAEELVAGRGARGLAVGLVAAAIEQAPAWVCGDGGAPALVLWLVEFAAKIAACCACAAFYYDCRRRQDRSGMKLEGMTKCCEMDGCDISDESEVEEFGFRSAFQGFRLT